jgi:hypothetical protein
MHDALNSFKSLRQHFRHHASMQNTVTSSMYDALNSFKSLLKEDPPSLEEIKAVSRKSVYDSNFNSQDTRIVNYIADSCVRLSNLCDIFYGRTERSEDYTAGGTHEPWESSPPKLWGATLIPVPSSYDVGDAAQLLSYASLYSGWAVLVLPHKIDHKYISYSGGNFPLGRISSDTVLKTMLFNLRYRSLVETGHVIFLPRELDRLSEGVSGHGQSIARAPLLQDPEGLRFTPINAVVTDTTNLLAHHSVDLVAEFLLPYFPNANLQDIARIKDTESDSFILFNSYLKRRLAALAEAQSLNDIADMHEEINAGIARLRIEAKKVADSKLLRDAEVGSLGLSLVAVTGGDPALTRIMAGVVGSASLLGLLRSFSEIREKKLDMRASEFFIPYLLDIKKRSS